MSHTPTNVAYVLCILFAACTVIFVSYNTFVLEPQVGVLDAEIIHDVSRGKAHRETRLLFVGDMMFDRTIRNVAAEHGYDYLFSCLTDDFTRYDSIVGNLEGPITTNASRSFNTLPGEEGNTQFTFDPSIGNTLAAHNIKIVSIGNNHIQDFGYEGIIETQQVLDAAGVEHFGNPTDASKMYIDTRVKDQNIRFVAYNDFLGDTNDSYKAIETAGEQSFVVVFAHWGDEYSSTITTQKETARLLAEAGADLIIGSHPHVIQESEILSVTTNETGLVKKVPVYYSLGNFIFDQYWDESVRDRLGVSVTIENGTVTDVSEHTYTAQRDGRVCKKETEV